MKTKTILIVLANILILISCNKKTKQPKEEALWNNVASQSQPKEEKDIEYSLSDDTTIYQNPFYAPELKDTENYFRNNNKYKNWDRNNKKNIRLYGIVEKDGTFVIEDIKGDTIKSLVEEAIRLTKEANIIPAKNEKNEIVRSYFFIGIDFPPH